MEEEEVEEEAIQQLTCLTISIPNSSGVEGSCVHEGVNNSSSGEKGVNEVTGEVTLGSDASQDEGMGNSCGHVTVMS